MSKPQPPFVAFEVGRTLGRYFLFIIAALFCITMFARWCGPAPVSPNVVLPSTGPHVVECSCRCVPVSITVDGGETYREYNCTTMGDPSVCPPEVFRDACLAHIRGFVESDGGQP